MSVRTTVGVSSAVLASIALSVYLLIPKGAQDLDGTVFCTVYVPPELRGALDAGAYMRMGGPGRRLADGGIITGGWPGVKPVRTELCTFEDTLWDGGAGSGGGVAPLQFTCACAKDAACLVALPDGGLTPAHLGATLSEGTFSGAGCVLKTCGVLAGMPEDWPAACPVGSGG